MRARMILAALALGGGAAMAVASPASAQNDGRIADVDVGVTAGGDLLHAITSLLPIEAKADVTAGGATARADVDTDNFRALLNILY